MSEPPLHYARHVYLSGGIPYGRLFVAVGVAVALLEIAALVVAVIRWRRGRGQPAGSAPPLRLTIVAGVAVLVFCAAGAGSLGAAQDIVLDAFGLHRAPWDAGHGIGLQIAAFPFMTTVVLAAALIWIAGLWLTLDARRRARGGDLPPVAAIVALGVVPTVVGIWRWRAIVSDALAAMAGQPPADRNPVVLRATDIAGARLEAFAHVSSITIAALALVALALIIRAHRRGALAAAPKTPRRTRASIAISAVALVAAAALFLAARPMRAENRLAWPAGHDDTLAWLGAPPTPDLVGTDALPHGPVVHLWPPDIAPSASSIELDHQPVPRDSLVDKLWVSRNEFARRNPGARFDGVVVLVVGSETPYRHAISVLRAIHDAGFPYAHFAFTRRETIERPRFGPVMRMRATGVRATLIDDIDKNYAENPAGGERGTVVRLSEFGSYEALAGKLVALRRIGQPVVLDLADLK